MNTLWSINADIAIVTYGRLFANAAHAVNKMKENGVNVKVVKLNRIKPLPTDAISEVLDCKYVFFYEESEISGGTGEIFNMHLNRSGYKNYYEIKAVEDKFVHHSTVEKLYEEFGFDTESIIKHISEVISGG